MSALPWIVGGLGLGLGILYVRSRQAKHEAENKSICDSLEGEAKTACQVASGIGSLFGALGDLFSGPDWDAHDKANKELNGEVKVPLPPMLRWRALSVPLGYDVLKGTVVEFENGCVPFWGAGQRGGPTGWHKCAPGTKPMHSAGIRYMTYGLDGKIVPNEDKSWNAASYQSFVTEDIATGRVGDALTQGPFTPGVTSIRDAKGKVRTMTAADFPLSIPPGQHGWFHRGRPMVCGPEGPNTKFRDHRAGHEDDLPPCGGGPNQYDPATNPPPPVGGSSPGGGTGSGWDFGNPPAGKTWDPVLGRFRALRQGETPQPRPVDPPSLRSDLLGLLSGSGDNRLQVLR